MRTRQRASSLPGIAADAETIALDDACFVSGKQYSNVDFYLGLIYEAPGDSVEMSPVLFAIGRTSGWTSRWLDMIDDHEPTIERHARSSRVAASFTTSRSPTARGSAPAGFAADAGRPIGRAVSAGNCQERMTR
jgi:hypothetical protein